MSSLGLGGFQLFRLFSQDVAGDKWKIGPGQGLWSLPQYAGMNIRFLAYYNNIPYLNVHGLQTLTITVFGRSRSIVALYPSISIVALSIYQWLYIHLSMALENHLLKQACNGLCMSVRQNVRCQMSANAMWYGWAKYWYNIGKQLFLLSVQRPHYAGLIKTSAIVGFLYSLWHGIQALCF